MPTRTPAAKTFASSVLPATLQPLRFAVTKGEDADYDASITDLIHDAAATLAAEMGTDASISDTVASRYLRDNSLSKLTAKLNYTTFERLQGAIADAWTRGGTADDIVKAITDTYADFSSVRAEMIAQTEANDAYNAGRRAMADEFGADEKSWDGDGEACEEICQPNIDAGWIPIDDDFPSGDQQPTAHPRCDCGLDFRKTDATITG